MEYAVSSYAAIMRPLQDVADELLGFGIGVEIICEPPHAWPAPVPWTTGRVTTLHMPILGINIASTNPGIREESVRQILSTIQEAARLGASGVVVHPGNPPPYEGVFPRDMGLPHAIESLRRLSQAAGAAGVEIYLENMPATSLGPGMPRLGARVVYGVAYEELRLIYESVGHPALRLCLDLGHAYLTGRDVLQAMLADRDVVHVHANDNMGWGDDHLAWGDGEISRIVNLPGDLPPSVRNVVFETKSLEASRASLRRVAQHLAVGR